MRRKDGFYWVRYGSDWTIAEWCSSPGIRGAWWLFGTEVSKVDSVFSEIGPRVQRDSEIMKQRDEAVELLRLVWQSPMLNTAVYKKVAEFFLDLIEAEKSGVKQ